MAIGLVALFVGAGLIVGLLVFAFVVGLKLGAQRKESEWRERLIGVRREIADKQRHVLKGKLSESFAPILEDFPFEPSECRFIGDPVDYVVFEGISKGELKGVHFVEVKSGGARLSKVQKQIKDKLDSLPSDEISFREFRFPAERDVLED